MFEKRLRPVYVQLSCRLSRLACEGVHVPNVLERDSGLAEYYQLPSSGLLVIAARVSRVNERPELPLSIRRGLTC